MTKKWQKLPKITQKLPKITKNYQKTTKINKKLPKITKKPPYLANLVQFQQKNCQKSLKNTVRRKEFNLQPFGPRPNTQDFMLHQILLKTKEKGGKNPGDTGVFCPRGCVPVGVSRYRTRGPIVSRKTPKLGQKGSKMA